MQISNARHTRVRTTAVMVAVVALLILPTVAHASHVGTVSITPAVGTVVADLCGPFLVQTQGGDDPIGAVVDVEVEGTTPVEFCLPASGVNPVLIDPTTGDLGDGTDGTIGGEATADASTLPGEGDFTFGIVSPASGSFDITVFVEDPGGPNDNDDPDEGEPQDTASLTVGWRQRQRRVDHHHLGHLRGASPVVGCRLRAGSQGRGEAGQEGPGSSDRSGLHRPVGRL
jgi:hypothetical protein